MKVVTDTALRFVKQLFQLGSLLAVPFKLCVRSDLEFSLPPILSVQGGVLGILIALCCTCQNSWDEGMLTFAPLSCSE